MSEIDPLVILAAGRSTRMGSPKALLDFKGRTWIEEQLERYFDANGSQAWVVTTVALLERLSQITEKNSQMRGRTSLIINPTPEQGPFSSLQCGIRQCGIRSKTMSHDSAHSFHSDQPRPHPSLTPAIPPHGFWILPIDVPAPKTHTWQTLQTQTRLSELKIVQPAYLGRGAHPVWISSAWADKLLDLDPSSENSRLDRLSSELADSAKLRIEINDEASRFNLNTDLEWQVYVRSYEPEP